MKVQTILFLLFGSVSLCSGQVRNLPIDSLSHIVVDSIVVYDDPYIVTNGEIEKLGFSPVWLKGFCSTSIPTYFNRKAKDGLQYIHNSIKVSEESLQEFYNKWVPKPDPSIDLTTYILGDIFFHDKSSNEKYIYSPAWRARYNSPVRLSRLDVAKLGELNRDKLDSTDAFFPFYRDDHGTYFFYKYEDDVYKKCFDLILVEVLKWDLKSFSVYSSAKDIINLAGRQKTYVRSRLSNGKRIFEIVKNTPNGSVVVSNQN